MVGEWTVTKPSRSDEVLDADQQLQIANQVRARFESTAPKRPTKPSRSESDETPIPAQSTVDQYNIPELDKMRSLQSQSPVLFPVVGASMVLDEFGDTQYYNKLYSIDKQHHTTGTGFIRVVREEHENGYGIRLSSGQGGAVAATLISGYSCNPATNDWTPSLEDDQVFVSSKPNRSESS